MLEELADEIARSGAARPAALVADLTERGAAKGLARSAREALGVVDILVNNAGGGVNGYQTALGDRDEGREVFEVNVWSPAALVAELGPGMRQRRKGAVVNVSSMMQVMPWPTLGVYTASKAALGRLS